MGTLVAEHQRVPPSSRLRPLRPPLVLLIVAGAASPAVADRVSIGASVGVTRVEGGTTSSIDDATEKGVFARLRLGKRISVEGALSLASPGTVKSDQLLDCFDCGGGGGGPYGADHGKSGSLTLRYDTALTGSIRPHLLAGGGLENWSAEYAEWAYVKGELGAGLDLVVTDGLRIGVDLRVGERRLSDSRLKNGEVILLYIPEPFADESRYATGRVTLSASL
jgi:hypothetical protein